MTFRMPLISRPSQGKKPDSSIARTFVSAGLALLVGASAFNPVPEVLVSRAANKRLPTPQTITANLVPLNSIAVVALPIGKTADRDPPRQLRKTYINRSWIETNDLPRQLAVTLPKQITDWPLSPRLKIINRDGQLQNVAALNTIIVSPQPFSLLDWQGPRKLLLDLPDWSSGNVALLNTVIVAPKPFLQLGWDLPGRKDSPLARERQRVNDLPRQLAVTLPARPYDWPIPKPKRAKIPDTLYGTLPPFKVVVPVFINMAATEAQDTASVDLGYWKPTPTPPDTWTPVPVNPDMWTAVNVNSDLWTKKNG